MYYRDIHNHTRWSDGDGTVEMLLNRARKHQLQELGICDHYEAIEHKRGYNQAVRDEIVNNLLNSLNCKIGFAHLDLEQLGEHRKKVVDFMAQHNIFLDFNFEGTFYTNLLQGYGQIEDVLVRGVEVVVGSDTHTIEEDWWSYIVAAHDYLSNTSKVILERGLKEQRALEKN